MSIDLRSLQEVITSAKSNIRIMRQAISMELKTIEHYQLLIGNSSFNDGSLEEGIERAKHNIARFESVIMRDQETLREHRRIIEVLNEREHIKKLSREGITIRVERE